MAKYNWRTHVWKVGDRCVVKSRGQTEDFWRGTVTDVKDGSHLNVRFDQGYDGCPGYAQCVPLRKKPKVKPREWWLCVYDEFTATHPYVFGKATLDEAKKNAHPGAEFVKVKEIKL